MGNEFFERLVETTRLSALFASNSVARICKRNGIEPAAVRPHDLPKLMDDLERVIRGFLPTEQHDAVLRDLESLSKGLPG